MPIIEVEAMVCSYHVYKEIWDASINKELLCTREQGDPRDPSVVAVVKSDQTVGHVRFLRYVCYFYSIEVIKCQNFR